MSNEAWDDEIELRKDPYKIKVGDDIFEFVAELNSDRFLVAYRKIHEVRQEASQVRKRKGLGGEGDQEDEGITPDQMEKLTIVNREYLATLMLEESAKRFMTKPLPTRVITLMAQKVMEYYGGDRPTGPSKDSSTESSTAGKRSTGSLPSKGSTRGSGR